MIYMCESGSCEGSCSPEVAQNCPIHEILQKLPIPVQNTTRKTADTIPNILRGPAKGSAERFFATGWAK